MSIERVGIVGGGQMGGGITEVCVKAGVDTIIVEINDDLVARSKAGIEKSLGKAVDHLFGNILCSHSTTPFIGIIAA